MRPPERWLARRIGRWREDGIEAHVLVVGGGVGSCLV